MSIQNGAENEATEGEQQATLTASDSATAAASAENPAAVMAEAPSPQPVKKLCGVCKEKEYKYKCTRCELPYCSIACLTAHKATHPALPPPAIAPPPSSLPAKPPPIARRPGTKSATQSQGPFAALDDSDDLRALFKLYPQLASQLLTIDTASLPPLDPPSLLQSKGGKRKDREKPWTTDIGLKKGVQKLKRMRMQEEGVMEYSKLVLQLLNGDVEENAAKQLQREEKEANAKIIEALLNGELQRV